MRRSAAKSHIDDSLLVCYLLTLVAGVIMVYSASSIMAESRFGSHWLFFRKQFMWAAISVFAVWIIGKVDLKRLAVYSAPGLLFSVLLLCLVFLMESRNGSQRWLFLGPLTMQPSELFKFLMIFYLAFSLSNPKRNLADLRQLLFPYVPIVGLGLALIVAEPDLGTAIVVFVTAVGLFFLAGARLKHLVYSAAPMVLGGSFMVFVLGYKRDRIFSYLATLADPLQGGYQVQQAALTLGAGGLFGVGFGDGRQKLFFLPYPHTDFILATMGEEIGFIGLLVVLGLLAFLVYRGCRIAVAQPDKFGFLLAAGMTWSLFVNIAINVGVVTALLPVTGLALPFFSSGGSSLLISSMAIGVLLNLSRRVKT